MTQFHIQFTRFSAFYSPLISTISGGFLAEEGLEATHSLYQSLLSGWWLR